MRLFIPYDLCKSRLRHGMPDRIGGLTLKTISRIAVPLFAVWLAAWLAISWGAVQDDALIHLRYADYLHRVHFITYDGIHPSYGTSSLFYVGLLALLRAWFASPLLSRAVSTVFHVLLFATLALCCLRAAKSASTQVQMFAVTLLLLLAVPSAVRWLDDGMETGIVLCLVGLVAWRTHRMSLRAPGSFLVAAALGFLLVILRNELAIVACLATAILCLAATGRYRAGWFRHLVRSIPSRSSFLIGAIVASIAIRLVMHSFLPDTALAKSHGIRMFFPALHAGYQVLGGALLFGLGTLGLWLASALVLLQEKDVRLIPTLAANALFPLVLLASALRGQEIQGVRYLTWTFFFSLVWNLLELWRVDEGRATSTVRGPVAFATIALACLVALPFETRVMYRVLTTRAGTMRAFIAHPALASAMPGALGVATDIGYISYFTGDSICDLAGLVNGRDVAALPESQRTARCVAKHPGFLFVNAGQAGYLAHSMDFSRWTVCGAYDFGNMSIPDRHYLIVQPERAASTCAATGYAAQPAAYALIERGY